MLAGKHAYSGGDPRTALALLTCSPPKRTCLLQFQAMLALSLSLRHMCMASWPGMADEGLLYFSDLTRPSLITADWSTPYGVNGLFLPLTIFGVYMGSLNHATPARSAGERGAWVRGRWGAQRQRSMQWIAGSVDVPLSQQHRVRSRICTVNRRCIQNVAYQNLFLSCTCIMFAIGMKSLHDCTYNVF